MTVRRGYRYSRQVESDEFRADESALAFPKPRYVPKGERVDASTLSLPKDRPDRDRAYLDFVRSEVCAIWPDDGIHCGGITEAAHLVGHGTSVKASDYLSAPLCTRHHALQHSLGVASFQATYGVNLWEVAARLLVRWIRRQR